MTCPTYAFKGPEWIGRLRYCTPDVVTHGALVALVLGTVLVLLAARRVEWDDELYSELADRAGMIGSIAIVTLLVKPALPYAHTVLTGAVLGFVLWNYVGRRWL